MFVVTPSSMGEAQAGERERYAYSPGVASFPYPSGKERVRAGILSLLVLAAVFGISSIFID